MTFDILPWLRRGSFTRLRPLSPSLATITFSSTISMLNNKISANFRFHFSSQYFRPPSNTYLWRHLSFIFTIPTLTSSFIHTHTTTFTFYLFYTNTHKTLDDITFKSLPYWHSLAIHVTTDSSHYLHQTYILHIYMYTQITDDIYHFHYYAGPIFLSHMHHWRHLSIIITIFILTSSFMYT